MTNFFLYCIKKIRFSGSPKGTPTTGVVELWKKTILQWKPMELGGVPQKIDEYFHLGPIFYVFLQGIGSLSCIRVYIIYVIPFGE